MGNGIHIVGDVHGEFGRLNCWINKKRPDIILQCGDFGYWPNWPAKKRRSRKPEPTPKLKNGKLYFCDGNHEDHWSLKALDDTEVFPNTFYTPRGSTLKLPDGRTVLFMGGADSIDKDIRTLGHDWFPDEIISESDIHSLPDQKIDIVISHTCPREFEIPYLDEGKCQDPSRMVLSYILFKYRPKEWYFGHWHFFKQDIYESHDKSWQCHWTALDRIGGFSRWHISIEQLSHNHS